jgi:hypothetical protein
VLAQLAVLLLLAVCRLLVLLLRNWPAPDDDVPLLGLLGVSAPGPLAL